MKKYFFILVALIGIGMSLKAQDASSNCEVKGTDNEYAAVDFYASGGDNDGAYFIVTNGSSKSLAMLKVTITAERDNPGMTNDGEPVTIFNGTLYSDKLPAPGAQSDQIPTKPAYRLKNFQVIVGNAVCEKDPE
jgi:hypothetical protein